MTGIPGQVTTIGWDSDFGILSDRSFQPTARSRSLPNRQTHPCNLSCRMELYFPSHAPENYKSAHNRKTMTPTERLIVAEFPRSNAYHPEWLLASASGGANSVWLVDWLTSVLDLKPGMNVLDLGCGRAASSIFLAREYDVTWKWQPKREPARQPKRELWQSEREPLRAS